jgi:hypothetical protein
VIFDPQKAQEYGRFIGRRYKDKPNIIWILGGDRSPAGVEAVWRDMAAGLKEGDGGRHVKTYHPPGGDSSSRWLLKELWLDFNMIQSGHDRRDSDNYRMVAADYGLKPHKPTLDGEPRYEDVAVGFLPSKGLGWFDDYDVRQGAYWALFAGAFGHTYGCHPIWEFHAPGRKPWEYSPVRRYWHEALDLPGAQSMTHVRELLESRPPLSRVPDQSLIVAGQGPGEDHIQATRGDDYLFVYVPTGKPVSVALGKISGSKVREWWFNPRDGEVITIGESPNQGTKQYAPPGKPGRGNDWILVLDDAAKKYPPPGGGGRP